MGDRHQPIAGIEAVEPASLTGAQALARLQKASSQFAAGSTDAATLAAGRSIARVKQTGTEGQKPFAAVLTCADSRTPPEIFLAQGVGDLFVVRVAGNVTDTMGLASLEYAVDHLGVPLVVVMGHTRCGAVDAAVKASNVPAAKAEPGHAAADPGNLGKLVGAIEPAVKAAAREGGSPILLAAIRQNVRQSMAQLSSRSPVLKREIDSGDLLVVGAVYDVETGAVDWLR
ncbi:MAG: carbonic anhydrase [Phycisphaerae bacterium]|nr:carbonic anhydrase [Phycisphaerae bacterium]